MKLLIAEDDLTCRVMLEAVSRKWGYEPVGVEDGEAAWQVLQGEDPPRLLLLDWEMPRLSGPALCQRVRRHEEGVTSYIMLLTARSDIDDIVDGLEAGANDFVAKPFQATEVKARLQVGRRMLDLDALVAQRTSDLETLNQELHREMAERERMETQLRLSQKLESVGQLAAGVAHEINTPTQYVGDNTCFLQEAFGELFLLYGHYARGGGAGRHRIPKRRGAASHRAGPRGHAADRQDSWGDERISHPGLEEKEPVDINRVIESTATVASNEWRYVAELDMDLESELPTIRGYRAELGQVLLNLIVNGAHAIAEVVGDGSQSKGRITVSTRSEAEIVEIRVSDTGSGIESATQEKMFDPFFTTKEVGKGTGQGLSIARSVVVDKHGGNLSFETESGRGTTFIIHLPIDSAITLATEVAA